MFFLYLPNLTRTSIFYKTLYINNVKCIYNFSVLVQMYKHKDFIPIFDHERKIIFEQNRQILIYFY